MTRVSKIEGDCGYTTCTRCRVFLAGSERRLVLIADEEKRFAEQYVLDDDGFIAFDKQGEARTEKFYGDVAVFCPCKGECPPWEKPVPASQPDTRPLFSRRY